VIRASSNDHNLNGKTDCRPDSAMARKIKYVTIQPLLQLTTKNAYSHDNLQIRQQMRRSRHVGLHRFRKYRPMMSTISCGILPIIVFRTVPIKLFVSWAVVAKEILMYRSDHRNAITSTLNTKRMYISHTEQRSLILQFNKYELLLSIAVTLFELQKHRGVQSAERLEPGPALHRL
jgi:hypothetical protein